MSRSLSLLNLKKTSVPETPQSDDEEIVEEKPIGKGKTPAADKVKTSFLVFPRHGLRMKKHKTKATKVWVEKVLQKPSKPKTWPKPVDKKKDKVKVQKEKLIYDWKDVYQLKLYSVDHDAYFFQLAVQYTPGPEIEEDPDDLYFKPLSPTIESSLVIGSQFNNGVEITSLPAAKERIFAYHNRLDTDIGFVSDHTAIEWDIERTKDNDAERIFTGAESFYYSEELLFGEGGPYMPNHMFQSKYPQQAETRGIGDLVPEEEPEDHMDEDIVDQPHEDEMEVEANEQEAEGSDNMVPAEEVSEEAAEPVGVPAVEDIPWTGRARDEKKVAKPTQKVVPQKAVTPKVNTLFTVPVKSEPRPVPKKAAEPSVILSTVSSGLQPISYTASKNRVVHNRLCNIADTEETRKAIAVGSGRNVSQHGANAPPDEETQPLPEKKPQAVKIPPKAAAVPVQSTKTVTTKNMAPKRTSATPAPAVTPEPEEKKRKVAEPNPAKAAIPEPATKKQATAKPKGKGKKAEPAGKALSSLNQKVAEIVTAQLKNFTAEKKKEVHIPEGYVEILTHKRTGPEWLKFIEDVVDGGAPEAPESMNIIVVALEMIAEKVGVTHINFGDVPLLLLSSTRGKTATGRLQSYLQLLDGGFSETSRTLIADLLNPEPIMLYTFLKAVIAAQHLVHHPFSKLLESADVQLEFKGEIKEYCKALFSKGMINTVYNTCFAIRSTDFNEDAETPVPVPEEKPGQDEFNFD